MFGRIAKVVAYARAPRKTFVVLHPIKALKFGAAFYVGKLLLGSRSNNRVTATHTRVRTTDGAGSAAGTEQRTARPSTASGVLDDTRMQERGDAI